MVGQICNIVNSELRGSLGTGVKSETTIFLQGRYRKVQNRLGETTGSREGGITADPAVAFS